MSLRFFAGDDRIPVCLLKQQQDVEIFISSTVETSLAKEVCWLVDEFTFRCHNEKIPGVVEAQSGEELLELTDFDV